MFENKEIHLVRTNHAPLVGLYVPKQQKHVKVGKPEHKGMDLPRWDPEKNARYVAFIGPDGSHPSDYQVGSYYKGNMFIYGVDWKSDDPMAFNDIENIGLELGFPPKARRVLVPRGFDGTEPTWYHALQAMPVERATSFWAGGAEKVGSRIEDKHNGVEVLVQNTAYGNEHIIVFPEE